MITLYFVSSICSFVVLQDKMWLIFNKVLSISSMERFSSKKCFYCPILTRYDSDNISLRGSPQLSIRLEQGIISYKTTDKYSTLCY